VRRFDPFVTTDTGFCASNWGIMVVCRGFNLQEALPVMSSEPQAIVPVEEEPSNERDSKALQMIGWFSIGMAVAALGIYLGAELRSRSKFNKRTPYDFYANAGEQQASEFGVGI
jgi:hypothetical protein